MFGFVFGTMCAVALVATAGFHGRARRRYGHGRGRCGSYGRYDDGDRGPGRRRRQRRRGARAAVFAEMLKRRLDVDEDQALVVDHAVRDVKDAVKELGEAMADARQEVAETLRAEVVDDAALDAVFQRGDEAVARARRHVVSAVKQVHAVLDEEQRDQVADALAGWDRGFQGRF